MAFLSSLYKNHEKEELIRTVDSLISIVLQLTTLGVQVFGLWWIMHHSH